MAGGPGGRGGGFRGVDAEAQRKLNAQAPKIPNLGARVREMFRPYRGRLLLTALLVIAGAADAVTPPSGSLFIQEHVAGAEYAEFQAAHLSNVEVGEPFSRRVIDFLLAR